MYKTMTIRHHNGSDLFWHIDNTSIPRKIRITLEGWSLENLECVYTFASVMGHFQMFHERTTLLLHACLYVTYEDMRIDYAA